jgi:hypothetical protein
MICPNPECLDYVASGTPGEYVDGVTVCPVCGEALMSASEWEMRSSAPSANGGVVAEPAVAEPELEAVFATSDPSEVAVIRSILQGAEIPCTTRPGHRDGRLGFFRPESQFAPGTGLVRFWVPADRAEEARALLTEVEPTGGGELSSSD